MVWMGWDLHFFINLLNSFNCVSLNTVIPFSLNNLAVSPLPSTKFPEKVPSYINSFPHDGDFDFSSTVWTVFKTLLWNFLGGNWDGSYIVLTLSYFSSNFGESEFSFILSCFSSKSKSLLFRLGCTDFLPFLISNFLLLLLILASSTRS